MAAFADPHRNICPHLYTFPRCGDHNWMTHLEQLPTQNHNCISIHNLIWWHLTAKLEPKRWVEMKKKKEVAILGLLCIWNSIYNIRWYSLVHFLVSVLWVSPGYQYGTQYLVFPTQSRNCAMFDMSSTKIQRISIPLGQRKSMPSESILEYEDQ